MDIITGYTGTPHITAENDRDINIGIFGSKSYVLQTGTMLTAEISNNNEIKVRDGVIMHQGCAASIKKNTYDSVTINNGSQGMKRIDLIVARYEKQPETNAELLTLKVLQGTPAETSPQVPAHTEGDIQAGDTVADMPLYEVEIDGLNITEIRKVFQTMEDLESVNGKIFSSDFIIGQTVTLNKVTLKGGTSTSFSEDLESKIPEGYTGIGGFLCSTNSETTVWSSYTYHHSDTGHFYIYASVRNWSSKDISSSPKALCFFVKK